MKTLLAVPLTIGFLCAVGAAHALDRKGSGSAGATTATKAAPLSGEECTGLGGNVVDHDACNSGKACHTTDNYGKHHWVCLSKK